MNAKTKIILLSLVFIVSVILIWYGQKTTGYGYLGLEVIGLVGILFVVYCYNKQYK